MSRKVIYSIGPYTAPTREEVDANIAKARAAAEILWKNGVIALCPHLNTAHFDGIAPYEAFVEGGVELLKRCDGALVLPGWEQSAGSLVELEVAAQEGIVASESFMAIRAFATGQAPEGMEVWDTTSHVRCPKTGELRLVCLHNAHIHVPETTTYELEGA